MTYPKDKVRAQASHTGLSVEIIYQTPEGGTGVVLMEPDHASYLGQDLVRITGEMKARAEVTTCETCTYRVARTCGRQAITGHQLLVSGDGQVFDRACSLYEAAPVPQDA